MSVKASIGKLASANRSLLLLAVLIGVFAAANSHFAGGNNITSILNQTALSGIIAIAMAVALIAGQFDLSVGSILALGGFVAVHAAGSGTAVAFLAAAGVGAACGLVNGFVVAVLRVNAFIATLGTMSAISGLTLVLSHQQSASTSANGFLSIPLGSVGPIPVFAIGFAAIALIAALVMAKTPIGVTARALGASPEFCRLNGVPMTRYRIGVFLGTGIASGLSGAMTAAWVGGADPNAGSTTALLVISACILGGVSLYGGVGTVGQAVGGTLALTVLIDGMTLLGVSPYWQTVLQGAVLVAVVTVAAVVHRDVITKVWFGAIRARVLAAWRATEPDFDNTSSKGAIHDPRAGAGTGRGRTTNLSFSQIEEEREL